MTHSNENHSNENRTRYALLGMAFGVMFPVVGTLIQSALSPEGLSVAGAIRAQSMPLVWIIDTAPIFLGAFAAMAGARQDRLTELMAEVERKNRELQDKNVALGEANVELVRAGQLKSQFLANMSHELRTPLNAIIGFTRILIKKTSDLLPERQAKNLVMVNESGHHLLALVNDILDIERIQAGMLSIRTAPLDIVALAADIVEKLTPAAEAKGLSVRAELPDEAVIVQTDEVRLRQVLDNLVNNAIKYSDTGTVTLRVVAPSTGSVRFEVVDEGIGIPPDMLSVVFDPFRQVDGSTTRAQGGVGLGLHLVSQIVELLGGTVGAVSEVGKGSMFSITLPKTHGTGPQAMHSGDFDSHPQGVGPTVLLIDDTPAMLEVMRSELVDAGFCVHAAMSGEEGLAMAKAVKPAVILLDIIMPEMDGWAVLKALKGSPELAHIPVVITSQLDQNPEALGLGVAGWLTKPTTPEAFREIFERVGLVPADDVLVVEDDPATMSLVVQHLSELGLSTRTAANGEAALVELGEKLPRAVVLDLMLPELDGFAVLEHLRGMNSGGGVPVVVYTAKDLTPDERKRLNIGPVDIMGKGTAGSVDTLADRVKAAVKKGTA